MMKNVWADLSRYASAFNGFNKSFNHVSDTRNVKIEEHQSCE
jgi:hypothetical protein